MESTLEREAATIWHKWADERARSGRLEQMIEEELFDHTWKTSSAQIIEILNLKPGETVADAGSGWGRLIHALKFAMPSLHICGYELTREFADRSRELLKYTDLDDGVVIECTDLTRATLPRKHFDAFYSSRVLHYIEDKQAALRTLYECLKPGGRGVIIVPNRHCPYRWFTYRHAPLYLASEIGRIMQELGFRNIRYGGFGFFPSRPRLPHTSIACRIDHGLSRTPLNRFAGLTYIYGER